MTIYELSDEDFISSDETRQTVTKSDNSYGSALSLEIDSADDILRTLDTLHDLY